jgi:hypothetical protein
MPRHEGGQEDHLVDQLCKWPHGRRSASRFQANGPFPRQLIYSATVSFFDFSFALALCDLDATGFGGFMTSFTSSTFRDLRRRGAANSRKLRILSGKVHRHRLGLELLQHDPELAFRDGPSDLHFASRWAPPRS